DARLQHDRQSNDFASSDSRINAAHFKSTVVTRARRYGFVSDTASGCCFLGTGGVPAMGPVPTSARCINMLR
uniref:Uncharacterized protein n=1 Tax=Anopheles minimus TaxID=112268 RepID=A0A182WMQ6_9DIPT